MDIAATLTGLKALRGYMLANANTDLLSLDNDYEALYQAEESVDALALASSFGRIAGGKGSAQLQSVVGLRDDVQGVADRLGVALDALDIQVPLVAGQSVSAVAANVTTGLPVYDYMVGDRVLGVDTVNDAELTLESDGSTDLETLDYVGSAEQGIGNLLVTAKGEHPAFPYWGTAKLVGGTDTDFNFLSAYIVNSLQGDGRISSIDSIDIEEADDAVDVTVGLTLLNGSQVQVNV